MEFTGLIRAYTAGRPIHAQEKNHHLNQKERIDVLPDDQSCVVRMNSTFLESVDKWYAWKGCLSLMALTVVVIVSIAYARIVYIDLNSPRLVDDGVPYMAIIGLMTLAMLVFSVWVLGKDSFAYTHYPIRFNRRTRMVHVFRPNGSVLSIGWDDIYFTLGHFPYMNEWEIRGYLLDVNDSRILETFPLSYVETLLPGTIESEQGGSSELERLQSHWEFVRRYMEEGPDAVARQVRSCLPIENRRESAKFGFRRVFANIENAPLALYWIAWPICAVIGVARIFAMRTSKVPRWPDDIEAACMVELDDPYAMDGNCTEPALALK